MTNKHRVYQLTLTALAPIHIGSGHVYTNKEFIYDQGVYYFPDMGKLYQALIKKNLQEHFEEFLRSSNRGNGRRLIHFLQANRVRERNFGGYLLRQTGFEADDPDRLNEVRQFIRDGLGNVYVPGSSLKGALRTILINTHWKEKEFIQTKGDKAWENRNLIPWGAKKGQDFDDIFHHIRVSDSQPISTDNLTISQKWDYNGRKAHAKPKPLPVYRESLKPGTKLAFTITATSPEAQRLVEQLPDFSRQFYQAYQNFFLNEFTEAYQQEVTDCPIYLGAGSGAWTKTKIDEAEEPVKRKNGHPKSKTRMVGKGVMKLTKSTGGTIRNRENFYEMGKASFVLEEKK